MVIAGETSGDLLAAELVSALRQALVNTDSIRTPDQQPLHATLEPRFFGAGGPCLAKAGVDLAFDMTTLSAIGPMDALKNLLGLRRRFRRLFHLAVERQPEAIVCVDFGAFNLRFARAIKRHVRSRRGRFHDWNPRLIQYVSPQVWASRQGRAQHLARDCDLLLSIFPFEKEWYAKHAPRLRVEFVGHPIADRYTNWPAGPQNDSPARAPAPLVALLPGSRSNELKRHLPVMLGALAVIRATVPDVRARMVLPNERLLRQAKALCLPAGLAVQIDGLAEVLSEASVAIASTGTVTVECARFGVPTVALYKTHWSTYLLARSIVKVKFAAMPNLLAGEQIMPEFLQQAATAEKLARAAIEFLRNESTRARTKARLVEVAATLGAPGASRRAANAIAELLVPPAGP
jgi:lipid-A-disaccharide synthase